MITVRPWRVRTELDEKDWLVIAATSYIAIGKHLRRIHSVGKKADRQQLIAKNEPATPLYPYTVIDRSVTKRRTAVYATDRKDAVRQAMKLTSIKESDEPFILGSDHLWALLTLSTDELIRQATYVWPDKAVGGMRYRIAPKAWRNTYKTRRQAPGQHTMGEDSRLSIALALRVAIAVPALAAYSSTHDFNEPGKTHPNAEIFRIRKVHAPNIPSQLVENLLARIGPRLPPFDPAMTDDLIALVEAYGYDPAEVPFPQVAALWTGGPAKMEEARLDASLGMYDWCANGTRRPKL